MQEIKTDTTGTITTSSLALIQDLFKCVVIQNFRLIWLHTSIDETNDDFWNSLTQLRIVVNTIDTFTDGDQCIDFLSDIQDERIFLIISNIVELNIIPLIHNVFQLNSVFIFDRQKLLVEDLDKNWLKVQGIYTKIESLSQALQETAKRCDQNLMSMSFVTSSASTVSNLDQPEVSFMYTQLLKEMVLETYNENKEKHIKDFVNYCRKNSLGGNGINKFEQEYYNQTPVWWYTSNILLYTMVNRGLRILEVTSILKIGFFIRDLHQYIVQLHQE